MNLAFLNDPAADVVAAGMGRWAVESDPVLQPDLDQAGRQLKALDPDGGLPIIATSTAGMKKQYAGLFTYACDDVRYKRKDNDEAWVLVKDAGIKMFYSYPYFEFIPGTKGDEEPIRFGDFVIDIDTKELAMGSAVKIIDWFQTVYGVDPEQWRVYLSGKKGVHLELPAEILGMEAGHKLLPLGYKRLAKDIEGELHLALDTSMYNRGTGKPYRRPNVMRETGTCKRQITPDALYEITDAEEYTAACSAPGPVWEPEEISLNGSLSAKVRIYLQEAIQQQEAIKLAPVLTDEEKDRLAANTPACMNHLRDLRAYAGKPAKTFNDIAIQLTAYAITTGMSEAAFLEGCSIFIENYPSSSLNTAQKRYENCRAR